MRHLQIKYRYCVFQSKARIRCTSQKSPSLLGRSFPDLLESKLFLVRFSYKLSQEIALLLFLPAKKKNIFNDSSFLFLSFLSPLLTDKERERRQWAEYLSFSLLHPQCGCPHRPFSSLSLFIYLSLD